MAISSSSCSHWWHVPIYLGMSATLVFIAITTANHPKPDDPIPTTNLALNASKALRLQGSFHIFATLLHISPELFLSSNESTVFAIHDSAISNLSIPPWAMRQLLRYHAVPSALPMAELFKKPPGFCLRTMVDSKNLVITDNDMKSGSVMINNVPVSQPDMFLAGHLSVHGILKPFQSTTMSSCNFSLDNARVSIPNAIDESIEWIRIIRLLSSNRFIPFAIGLNAVLDGIMQDFKNLTSVTLFAPQDFGFTALPLPSPILGRIMRLHIVHGRLTSLDLSAAENRSVETLIPGCNLKIGRLSGVLTVNGVEITGPDKCSSKKFVIHGISRDFDPGQFFNSL